MKKSVVIIAIIMTLVVSSSCALKKEGSNSITSVSDTGEPASSAKGPEYEAYLVRTDVGNPRANEKVSFDTDALTLYQKVQCDGIENERDYTFRDNTVHLSYQYSWLYSDGSYVHYYTYEPDGAVLPGSVSTLTVGITDKDVLYSAYGPVIGKVVIDDPKNDDSVKNAVISAFSPYLDFSHLSQVDISHRDSGLGQDNGVTVITFSNKYCGAQFRDDRFTVEITADGSVNKYVNSTNGTDNLRDIKSPLSSDETDAIAVEKVRSALKDAGFETFSIVKNGADITIEAIGKTAFMYNDKPAVSVVCSASFFDGGETPEHATLTVYIVPETQGTTSAKATPVENSSLQGDLTDGQAPETSESADTADGTADDLVK